MSFTREQLVSRRKSERGSVTIMTAVLMVGLVLVVGLSIDVSRIYMIRSGLQNAADAAALAAARELNSGTAGITEAVTQANAVVNKYGFNRYGVTAPQVVIQSVLFGAGVNGPWLSAGDASAAGVVATIKYVKVTTQPAVVTTLFAGKVLGASHSEQRSAVAGASVGLNTICNIFPIAVALTPANQTNLLIDGNPITFSFQDDITGSSAAVADHKYAVMAVAGYSGISGAVQLAGGIPNICVSLGQSKALDSSMPANKKNGRDAISDGANTRFNVYANGTDPITFPPDTNIQEGLTSTQYLNKTPLTAPTTNTGKDDRRILLMPIIEPLPAGASTTIQIKKFGAFLLRNKVKPATKSGCPPGTPSSDFCGADMELVYLGNNFVIGSGSYDPNNPGSSTLTIPVLYK